MPSRQGSNKAFVKQHLTAESTSKSSRQSARKPYVDFAIDQRLRLLCRFEILKREPYAGLLLAKLADEPWKKRGSGRAT
jgi:hypothetical protein